MQGNIKKKKSLVKGNSRIVFLVWDREGIRAYGISKHIGASLHFLHASRIRHPLLFIKTLQILRKERPRIIICQSPPITCAFIAMVYRFLFCWMLKPKIIIDVHTGAISRPWSKTVSKLIMKQATANIVINKEQQNLLIQKYNLRPLVLEDPVPDFTDILLSAKKQDGYKTEQRAAFNVAVISSFAYDEPLDTVFDAALQLPEVYFYITGDKKTADKNLLIKKSDNVIMTGFLDYNTYVDLLQKVDVIMDLTTDSKSIVAGGCEAVALEQPLITSNWIPLKRYFNKGTIYINNSSDEIRKAIMTAMTRKEELSKQMHQLKIEMIKEWRVKFSTLYYLFN
jgi:glycosyltransferase involved in cell wall biosynthesis